jgi:hypothetical protein
MRCRKEEMLTGALLLARCVQFQIATVTSEGVEVSETMSAETTWGFAEKLRGYGAQTQ